MLKHKAEGYQPKPSYAPSYRVLPTTVPISPVATLVCATGILPLQRCRNEIPMVRSALLTMVEYGNGPLRFYLLLWGTKRVSCTLDTLQTFLMVTIGLSSEDPGLRLQPLLRGKVWSIGIRLRIRTCLQGLGWRLIWNDLSWSVCGEGSAGGSFIHWVVGRTRGLFEMDMIHDVVSYLGRWHS